MTFQHITKPRRVHYFGRNAFVQEYYLNLDPDSRGFGPRVIVRRWVDTGDVEVRAVTGDARYEHTFHEYESVRLDRPAPERTALTVMLLATKHFV